MRELLPDPAGCLDTRRVASPSITVEGAEVIAVVTKALADPVRLRIFHFIATSPTSVCACQLPEEFGVSQPTLSHHLRKLTDAGLLHREVRGRWAHYTPRPEGLAALLQMLTGLPSAPEPRPIVEAASPSPLPCG